MYYNNKQLICLPGLKLIIDQSIIIVNFIWGNMFATLFWNKTEYILFIYANELYILDYIFNCTSELILHLN